MSEANSIPALPPAPPPSPRQVLLGLFILFQLAFLIVANLLGFVVWAPTVTNDGRRDLVNRLAPGFAPKPDKDETTAKSPHGHGWEWSEQVNTNIRRWTQLTGQDQGWALFTSAYKGTGFPALLLIFEDAAPEDPTIKGMTLHFDPVNGFNLEPTADSAPFEVFLSANEPKDIHRFMRTGNSKVRKYDGTLYFSAATDGYGLEGYAKWLTRRITTLHTDSKEAGLEYMKWRLKAWEKLNPDTPGPKQVILMQRFYRIHDPEESFGWDGPFQAPMFRWLPQTAVSDGEYPVERFDFTTQRFTR